MEFVPFSVKEAALAQAIFNANGHLKANDPTFGHHPLEEFTRLLASDNSPDNPGNDPGLLVRKISNEAQPIGYLQLEINTPAPGECWIPMLVLYPHYQSSGFGKLIVASIVRELSQVNGLQTIGLNVYAENPRAVRFWHACGFNRERGVEIEQHDGQPFTCLTLEKAIH